MHSVSPHGGLGTKQTRHVPAYTQVSAPVAPSGISQAGQKALAIRSKKILSPLADPNQNIAE